MDHNPSQRCVPGKESPPKVVREDCGDGSFISRTTDADPWYAEQRAKQAADIQAALDKLRGQGITHPVLFVLGDDEGDAAWATWQILRPDLMKHGIAIAPLADARARKYVVRTDTARQMLQSIVGKKAKGYFRAPGWAISYWGVYIGSGRLEVYESQTFKDIQRDGPPKPVKDPPAA